MASRFQTLSRGRITTRGAMNKTESRYAELLTVQKMAGEIVEWWFEPFSLRLSSNVQGSELKPARYTPDFLVLLPDGETHVVDVKGSGLDDFAGDVRLKMAAEKFTLWRFYKAKERRKRDGGGFVLSVC